ncbi:peptide synthetase [Kocuria sp.]|uniref:peptide synthetase n=1 Tax=Kocuria sp. TaxID=1871328 RepID=UPI0026DEADB2|nr:peptide synthetase [Kocuria sp.]MDO5617598.1 peptide synthetase [Kocuria sp.]
MYLTNITHAALPEGIVASCALLAPVSTDPISTDQCRELPISFDQRMHVSAGDRPGTWMAVSFELPGPATRQDIGAAWLRVIQRHHTLRTFFDGGGFDGGGPTPAATAATTAHDVDSLRLLEVPEPLGVRWEEHNTAVSGTRAILRSVLDRGCSPMARPAHRLCVIEPTATDPRTADAVPTVVIAADHAHLDAWSLPVLAHDFLEALVHTKSPARDTPVEPAAAFWQHTRELAARAPSPEKIKQRWQEILAAGSGAMPVFPLPLGELEPTPPECVTTSQVLDARQLAEFEHAAEHHGQRPLTLVVSAMTQATTSLAEAPLRAVLPVHSRTDPQWRDAVGWFITNSVVESDNPDLPACRTAIREALSLGSYALEPMMRPYGGMPVPPGMFMISYLDYRRLPAALPASLNPQHVSASAPTNGVQVWFVVTDAGLHLRARYPDTPQAQESVNRWLAAVAHHLRTIPGTEPCPTPATLHMN